MKKIILSLILFCSTGALAATSKVQCSGGLSDGATASVNNQQFVIRDSINGQPVIVTLLETTNHSIVLYRWSPDSFTPDGQYALRLLDKNLDNFKGHNILMTAQGNLNAKGTVIGFDNNFISTHDLKFDMACYHVHP